MSTKLDKAIDGLADVVPNGHLLVAGSGYDLLVAATEEIDRLRARLADYEADARRVLSEQCAPDEKHCACVPVLRARVAELEARPRVQILDWITGTPHRRVSLVVRLDGDTDADIARGLHDLATQASDYVQQGQPIGSCIRTGPGGWCVWRIEDSGMTPEKFRRDITEGR